MQNGPGSILNPVPAIRVTWDPNTQQTEVGFNVEEFKDWDFVIAVLGMAIEKAKTTRNAQIAMHMQQQQAMAQQQMAQEHHLRKKLGVS